MKVKTILLIWAGIMMALLILVNYAVGEVKIAQVTPLENNSNPLKKAAFKVLDTKCNVCHRKQNPFMVFKHKNMVKRAPKIYKQVFIERRMPKGDEIRLTQEEFTALEKWLFTQQIF